MKTLNHGPIMLSGDIFVSVKNILNAGNNGCSIIIPHVCNNINLFGAGFTNAINQHYPIVKENYHLLGSNFLKNHLGYTQFVEVEKNNKFGHKLIIANMIAQRGVKNHNNPRPLHYPALCSSMISVSKFQENFAQDSKVQIHAPKFGCGLAGGNWNFIRELVVDIWHKTSVFIYTL
jgi:hypothetical protein